MSLILISRPRRRLRKLPTRPTPIEVDLVGGEGASFTNAKGASKDSDSGVVRVGYTVRPRHVEQIDSTLVAVRRTTGNECTASDIIRLALDELAKTPIATVIELLTKHGKPNRGRR